jgi:hypothetical protein
MISLIGTQLVVLSFVCGVIHAKSFVLSSLVVSHSLECQIYMENTVRLFFLDNCSMI